MGTFGGFSGRMRTFTAVSAAGGVAAAAVFATLAGPASAAVTGAVITDTYVRSGAPTATAGSRTWLAVGGTGQRVTFLQLRVANATAGQARSVKLRLHADWTVKRGVSAFAVPTSSWDAATLSWNDRPAISGSALAHIAGTTAGGWSEFDVSRHVTGNGTFGIALVADGSTGPEVHWSSLEGAVKPTLTFGATGTTSASATPTTTRTPTTSSAATPSATRTATATPTNQAGAAKPVFVIYYLWWSNRHWHDKLGPNYPYAASPNPMPGRVDASSCGSVTNYPGNQLTDISQGLAYDQDKPGVIEKDVRLAAAAGVSGFQIN